MICSYCGIESYEKNPWGGCISCEAPIYSKEKEIIPKKEKKYWKPTPITGDPIPDFPDYVYMGLSRKSKNRRVDEPDDKNYARACLNNHQYFTKNANGIYQNQLAITFPESIIDWGTIKSVFFSSNPAGKPDVLATDDFSKKRYVSARTTVQFAIGSLSVATR